MRRNSNFPLMPWTDYQYNPEPDKPNDKHLRMYKKFVIYAVFGKLREADELVTKNRAIIQKVASYLQQKHPPALQSIFRGMLIPLVDVPADRVAVTPKTTQFISFSEELQVACWFASVDAIMGEVVMQQYPTAVGWIGEIIPQLTDILFYYSWLDALNEDRATSIYQVALEMQAQLGSDDVIRQLHSNITRQKEVICAPTIRYSLRPVADYQCLTARDLDNRYMPRPDFILAPPGLEQVGIPAGQRINVERAQYYKPRRACHKCRKNSILYTYFLQGTRLTVDICQNCNYVFYFSR